MLVISVGTHPFYENKLPICGFPYPFFRNEIWRGGKEPRGGSRIVSIIKLYVSISHLNAAVLFQFVFILLIDLAFMFCLSKSLIVHGTLQTFGSALRGALRIQYVMLSHTFSWRTFLMQQWLGSWILIQRKSYKSHTNLCTQKNVIN